METKVLSNPLYEGNNSFSNIMSKVNVSSIKSKKMSNDVTHDLDISNVQKHLNKTSLLKSTAWALGYILSVPIAVSALLYVLFQVDEVAGMVLIPFTMIFIARQQRGLELMVHDASHNTWVRKNRRRNNIISTLVVGFPCLSSTFEYVKSHFPHHVKYASEVDPCKARFKKMGLGDVDLSTRFKRVLAVIKWLPSYNFEYYKEIGSIKPYVVYGFISWHFIVFILPVMISIHMTGDLSLGYSLISSILLWMVFWAIPFTGILPILRSIAEAEEHDYDAGNTEFDTTYTNTGLFHYLVIHPWFDSYHQIHHMYPLMPAYNHGKWHKLLMQTSRTYRDSMHRNEVLKSNYS